MRGVTRASPDRQTALVKGYKRVVIVLWWFTVSP